MIILTGAVLLVVGLWLMARTEARPGRHRASGAAAPAPLLLEHARRRSPARPGSLEPARPHRLVAQDAALSRR